ncbi:hypothetical protein [Micromonospora craniellae]|uniref:Uncharacterized protein n=1 Tax=Micromonospora craniellae TaxID=2294034 RepID=A0A372FSI9_9ACTN|nr:hypothetical protein [Micromonospora craniellae]QOC94375.1 hypothetical protein ID554_12750 [Micromonospora craniellae]RFS43747.1 hypothetical protein D0Q02_26085 [Micromonospora craniellae]
MPDRNRPSRQALLPRDVTDPLLWRLALDVLTAHPTGPDDRCVNLQCADHAGPCVPARRAHRAMRAARTTPAPPPHRVTRVPERFIGWFTATATHLRSRIPQRLPDRIPGAANTAAHAA